MRPGAAARRRPRGSPRLLLAVCGGAAGIGLSVALLRAALYLIPQDLPRLYDIGVDGRVMAFAVALSQ